MIVRKKVKPYYSFICDIDRYENLSGKLVERDFKIILNGGAKSEYTRSVSYPVAIRKIMNSSI